MEGTGREYGRNRTFRSPDGIICFSLDSSFPLISSCSLPRVDLFPLFHPLTSYSHLSRRIPSLPAFSSLNFSCSLPRVDLFPPFHPLTSYSHLQADPLSSAPLFRPSPPPLSSPNFSCSHPRDNLLSPAPASCQLFLMNPDICRGGDPLLSPHHTDLPPPLACPP